MYYQFVHTFRLSCYLWISIKVVNRRFQISRANYVLVYFDYYINMVRRSACPDHLNVCATVFNAILYE
jgi:hypothetical protein